MFYPLYCSHTGKSRFEAFHHPFNGTTYAKTHTAGNPLWMLLCGMSQVSIKSPLSGTKLEEWKSDKIPRDDTYKFLKLVAEGGHQIKREKPTKPPFHDALWVYKTIINAKGLQLTLSSNIEAINKKVCVPGTATQKTTSDACLILKSSQICSSCWRRECSRYWAGAVRELVFHQPGSRPQPAEGLISVLLLINRMTIYQRTPGSKHCTTQGTLCSCKTGENPH